LEKIERGSFDQKIDFDDIKTLSKQSKKVKSSIKKDILKDKEFMKKLGTGNYNNGKKRTDELAKKNWYRTDSLSSVEIEALSRLGYEKSGNYKPVFDFHNKKVLVVAYILGGFKDSRIDGDKRESMQHFSKPHFLKEEIPSAVPEYTIPGQKTRVDAAIILENKTKIAIEFQGVLLSKDAMIQKVRNIIPHFDSVFMVCKKEDLLNFKNLEDGKTIFVMFNKQFAEQFVPKYKGL